AVVGDVADEEQRGGGEGGEHAAAGRFTVAADDGLHAQGDQHGGEGVARGVEGGQEGDAAGVFAAGLTAIEQVEQEPEGDSRNEGGQDFGGSGAGAGVFHGR